MYDEKLFTFKKIIDVVKPHISLKLNIFVPSIELYNKNDKKQHNVLLKSGYF